VGSSGQSGLPEQICSTVDLHGLQADSLPHHGLHHRLQGKNLCSGTWSISSSSFFTDLGVCKVVSLTYSHSSLSTAGPQQVFLPLECVITGMLPLSLISLALASRGSVRAGSKIIMLNGKAGSKIIILNGKGPILAE